MLWWWDDDRVIELLWMICCELNVLKHCCMWWCIFNMISLRGGNVTWWDMGKINKVDEIGVGKKKKCLEWVDWIVEWTKKSSIWMRCWLQCMCVVYYILSDSCVYSGVINAPFTNWINLMTSKKTKWGDFKHAPTVGKRAI